MLAKILADIPPEVVDLLANGLFDACHFSANSTIKCYSNAEQDLSKTPADSS